MQRRIHIVGCSPRSGTTLMTELMVNGFEIDGFVEHESSIFNRPARHFDVFCSKNPPDVVVARPLLAVDRNLWIIYMLRDPRDVVVSRHGQDGGKHYWGNLRIWKEWNGAAVKMARHPRFLTVRYEELTRDPDRVQEWLMSRMTFLKKRTCFSSFHTVARPSQKSLDALRGLRPISAVSVGRWRENKPRLAAQLKLHGPITDELVKLGYESDGSWLRELDGVVPENGTTRWGDRITIPPLKRVRRSWTRNREVIRYILSDLPGGKSVMTSVALVKRSLRGRV